MNYIFDYRNMKSFDLFLYNQYEVYILEYLGITLHNFAKALFDGGC